MQNVDTTENNDAPKEIKTVEIDQTTQTSAMTGPSLIENAQVPTSQSTFGLDVSCSDDDEVSEVFFLNTLKVALLLTKCWNFGRSSWS